MSPRTTDECWEALVEETQAVPEIERGALNTALRAIRACCLRDGIHQDSIPEEIRIRARAYRTVMGHCTLTPMALAKHWNRVLARSVPVSPTQATMNALRHPKHGDVQL